MEIEYKTPLANAPKYRPTGKSFLNPILFCAFKKKHPEHKEVKNKDLSTVIKTFNSLIAETACEFRDGVELPEDLGVIIVASCVKKDDYLDIEKSRKTGKRTVNRNWNTDGFIVKIFFINKLYRHNYKHKELWKFKGNMNFRRMVSKKFQKNWKFFIQASGMTGMFIQASKFIKERRENLKAEKALI